jgi:hypothetical protein
VTVADVKKESVDKLAERIKRSNPNLSSEQAHKVARGEAERVNRERKEQKR